MGVAGVEAAPSTSKPIVGQQHSLRYCRKIPPLPSKTRNPNQQHPTADSPKLKDLNATKIYHYY
ncbi:hypothetical protein CCACVL1_30917 [Corchorus capsularis]|uniref:Uncharacterized protein n=1 Tax=Corchorus capsularis TaxID=210143 RepID=A0A1R3FUN8_COCAP|nr:hypothetical protein CCACVL1_30917 [Corchorus capsularis]